MGTETARAALPERLRLCAHLFVASMVLTWIVGTAPYPFAFGVIATSALSVTFATLALVATAKVEQVIFLRMVLVAGGALAVLSLISSLASLLIHAELVARSRCEATAITSQAVTQCEDAFRDAVQDRFPITLP